MEGVESTAQPELPESSTSVSVPQQTDISSSGTAIAGPSSDPPATDRDISPDGAGYFSDNEGTGVNFIIPNTYNDEDFPDEGYGSSETSSYMSSILSSVRRGVEENGRVYPSFGKHTYGLPIDDQELNRNDIQHQKFTLLLDNKLYIAPISDATLAEAGSRVLDIGTGTGVWAIDMADKFPNAEIVGSDIAAIQPSFVPPNCIFEIEDAEEDWPYPPQHFDFIHGRDLLTAIRDWPKLMTQAHNALRPGGWIQFASTIPLVRSDDNTLPPNSAFKEAGDLFQEIGRRMNAPITAPREWSVQLRDAGFINVQDVVIKIPSSPWARDKRLRNIGALEMMMLMEGLESYMLRGCTQVLGMNADNVAVLCALAKRELQDPGMHAYVDFHVTFGQRPEGIGGVT